MQLDALSIEWRAMSFLVKLPFELYDPQFLWV
ncbi:hypothetical protein ABIC01_008584 [Bradyrhizobium sp. RT4b]